jgi:hypothetical protein
MFPASQITPDFGSRRALSLNELAQLDDPAVIFEHFHVDTDGAHAYVYTVAGWIDGQNVARVDGLSAEGCTVGGDVIVIHADDRQQADQIATQGLQDTIDAARGGERSAIATHAERLRA